MMRLRRLLAGVGVSFALALPACTAHAEDLGQYHLPTGKRVCIEDHGWTTWDDVLPNIAWRLRSNGITDTVVWNDCGTQPSAQVITIAVSDSPNEAYCARTERGAYSKGIATGRTTIRVNKAARYWKQCMSTWSHRAHVMSHEVGHALGLVHRATGVTVMASPQRFDLLWFTTEDYRDLKNIYRRTA